MSVRLSAVIFLTILAAALFLTCSPGLGLSNSDMVPLAPNLKRPVAHELVINTTPTFIWQEVEDCDGYDLQIDDDDDFSSPVVDKRALDDIFYELSIVEQLENKQSYHWRVRGYNKYGAGKWSVVRDFAVDEAAYPTPVLSYPSDGSFIADSTPKFDWSAQKALYYSLAVSEDPQFDSYVLLREFVDDSEYQMVTELTPGKTYYWRVRAGGDNRWGRWSDAAEFYLCFDDPDYEYYFNFDWTWRYKGNFSYQDNPSRLHHSIDSQPKDEFATAYCPYAHHLEPGDFLEIQFEFSDHDDPNGNLGIYHGLISYLSKTIDAQGDLITATACDNNGQPEVNLTIINDYVVETIGKGEDWSQGYGEWYFRIYIEDWNSLYLRVMHDGTLVHRERHTLETTDFHEFLTLFAAVAALKSNQSPEWNGQYDGDTYHFYFGQGEF